MSSRDVWTIAEQSQGKIKEVSYEILTRGRKLADKLGVELASILLGYNISDDKLNELIHRGADKVYIVNDSVLENFIVENYSNVLVDLLENINPIL